MLGQGGLPNKVRKVRLVHTCAKSQWRPEGHRTIGRSSVLKAKARIWFLKFGMYPWFSILSQQTQLKLRSFSNTAGPASSPSTQWLSWLVSGQVPMRVTEAPEAMDALTSGGQGCHGCWLTAMDLLEAWQLPLHVAKLHTTLC